jgi:selenide,water dikinase
MQGTRLPDHEIVLLGIGHTNAHILRMWRMKPIQRTRLTCVSNHPLVTYSGMLPGVLAGQYTEEQMQIDLVRLCAANGARLIIGNVIGLDKEKHTLLFDDRPALPFDALSVGIGSVIRPKIVVGESAGAAAVDSRRIFIKPMQTLMKRLRRQLQQLQATAGKAKLAVVGGGAGGVEVALCIGNLLRKERPEIDWSVHLISGASQLIPEYRESSRKLVVQALQNANVTVHVGCRVNELVEDGLQLANGEVFPVDLAVWASGSAAPSLLSELNLPVDSGGYLAADENLQSTSGLPVFAVGDSAALPFKHVTKAGVFAVREGPVLWNNLQRILRKEPLIPYRPQKDFMRLLNKGDGSAIGQYWGRAFQGQWVWKLKDRIDVQFMQKYQTYDPMTMVPAKGDEEEAMRCLGCGGKVGGSILRRVLDQIQPFERPETIKGIESGGDDAAVLSIPAGAELTATTDFFAAPWDDPFTVGRIAALHSASDCFAMGSDPFAALANITLPLGKPRRQEACLLELMAGANNAFREMEVSLVGGHTIEGPLLAVGFTVLSHHQESALLKSALQPGDQLIMTKPVGIGVLLAAHMQARCRGEWWLPCLAAMCASNGPAAKIARRHGASAMTDVTGFGLAGHLGEMLEGSGLSAVLESGQLPVLPGACDLVAEELESTLAPANRDWERIIKASESIRATNNYALLFDPQTSGGLLIAVKEDQCESLLVALAETQTPGTRIGEVVAQKSYVELRVN